MALVAAKCTNCGANLTVDNSKDAAICEFCGTPFIVEKAIANVTMGGNNSIAVENAVFNIQGINNGPSASNLLQRAQEFELQGNYVVAVEYYERVLDLDYSNAMAREAIDRIKNSSILSVPVFGGFSQGTLTLTRKTLTYQKNKKVQVIPLDSILSVNRLVARLMVSTRDVSSSLDLAIGSIKNAKEMEQTLKKLLAEKQYFK